MTEILAFWGLAAKRSRPDILLPGSPERSVTRMAVEDTSGQLWMLEKLHPGQADRRERIGRSLTILAAAGLPIPAYLPGADGLFHMENDGDSWQLSQFVDGDPLPQPDFVDHAERGESLGLFVAGLQTAGQTIREFDNEPPLILEDYILQLMETMELRQPTMHAALQPVLTPLTPLFTAWPDLPTALCHGDFHPLNSIWREESVAAVIDWEFMGIRPTLFDVANCLGCIGIEDPKALVRGLAPALLLTLKRRGCLDLMSLSLLPELILAMRFAWMSEWLRKQDAAMAELELRYMRLLANSLDTLLPAWEKILAG